MSRFFLESGTGPIPGEHYLTSRPGEVQWGWLPNRDTAPVLKVLSGETVTIDTVSHEGLMEDQGSDPVAYLAQFGVGRDQVLTDARTIAREIPRDSRRRPPRRNRPDHRRRSGTRRPAQNRHPHP